MGFSLLNSCRASGIIRHLGHQFSQDPDVFCSSILTAGWSGSDAILQPSWECHAFQREEEC